MGRGVPSPANYGFAGASRDPQRGPGGNAFWRILKATERSFLHLYADASSSSNSVSCHIGKAQIWGGASIIPCPNVKPSLYGYEYLRISSSMRAAMLLDGTNYFAVFIGSVKNQNL